MSSRMTVSASPHVRSRHTTTGIMLDVIIALIPTLVASVILFGFRALALSAVCVGTCLLSEYISRKIMRRSNTLGDLSAVVTGLILAFNLPVTLPFWMAALGCVFAIVVAKQFFGGIGQNFVNPAIAGRLFLLISFSAQMSVFTQPLAWRDAQSAVDATTGATPLAAIAQDLPLPTLNEMFFGLRQGSMGEVCALALLLGFVYLLLRRVISPVIPLCFIGTVAVIMLIASKGDFTYVAYQLLGGGLLLGAIFMATDYSTSPIHPGGKIIFGIGCGAITCLIRLYASMPEGVSFAILLMNILLPHIESLSAPKPFGTQKEKREKEEAQA